MRSSRHNTPRELVFRTTIEGLCRSIHVTKWPPLFRTLPDKRHNPLLGKAL